VILGLFLDGYAKINAKSINYKISLKQCFSTGVPRATSKCAAKLFVFTFLLGERRHFVAKKVVLLGLFLKISWHQGAAKFFLMLSEPRVKKG
jgi:hypothetical protein